jgi:hypothetical protein
MTRRFASLFFLWECLTPCLQSVRVSKLHAMISSNSVNWDYVISFANAQLVITALWKALCAKRLQEILPGEVRSYLMALHSRNHHRNSAIRRQTEEIIGNLNLMGVEPLVLKGAALMLTGVYQDPAERIMVDIDIMVRHESATKTKEILSALGYRSNEENVLAHERFAHHLPPMVRETEPASVEIHTDLFHPLDDPPVLELEEIWEESERVSLNGMEFRVLSPTHFVVYNIVHSEVHHRGFALSRVPARDLLDFAFFLQRRSVDVDWYEIDPAMRRHGLRRIMGSYLFMGSRLFGVTIPAIKAPAPVGRWLHYSYCIILACCPRIQAVDDWRTFLAWNAVRFYRLFSARRMRLRFGCSDGWMDLTKTRLQYLSHLAKKYIVGPERSHLIDLLAGREVVPASDTTPMEGKDEIS